MKSCSFLFFLEKCWYLLFRSKKNTRQEAADIHPIFLERRSLYAMSGERISNQVLMQLFEAARWAPSEYNTQPWRFIYAHRETASWDRLFSLLVPWNQQWAQYASTLVLIISRDTFEYNNQNSRTHSFTTGAAWMSFALQATFLGVIAHGISGFDYEKARLMCNVPEGYTIQAMCVVGLPGDINILPKEFIVKEVPSTRKTVDSIISEGVFNFSA